MECNATHTHPSSLPTPALLPSIRTPRAAAAFASAMSPLPGLTTGSPPPRQLPSATWRKSWSAGGAAGRARAGGAEGDASRRRGDKRGAQSAGEGVGRWRGAGNGRREAPDPTRVRRGKRAARGSSAGGRSGRQVRPGSGGAAALTSLGAAVPPVESQPWLVRAGARVPGSGPRLRAPGGAARAPRPALDSRGRSAPGAFSPGGNNGAEAGAPEAGRRGGLPSAARGLQTLWPPSPDPAAAPHASCSPGSIALRRLRRRGVPDCSPGTVRPAERLSDRRKVCGLLCFSSCGERSRRGKARSPQCAKQSLGPVRTLPPSSGHSPGSSARCAWTGVRAAARCRPLLGRHTSARRSAPSAVRRRGARAPSPTPTPR